MNSCSFQRSWLNKAQHSVGAVAISGVVFSQIFEEDPTEEDSTRVEGDFRPEEASIKVEEVSIRTVAAIASSNRINRLTSSQTSDRRWITMLPLCMI